MKVKQDKDTCIIYIEQGEPIMHTLIQFCKDNEIQNGQISGIGAINEVELGVYDLMNKKYLRQFFKENFELVSFQGNISLKDDTPFIHAHITIADHHFNVKGGHLFEAKVAAVGEFILRIIDTTVAREMDSNIGLPTLCFMD